MDYRKVGRGGAGNYYSQDDVQKALKNTEDVEAQRPTAQPRLDDIEKARSEYAHSGRGGAGNYSNATKLAEATAQTAGVTPALAESKPPAMGHYGRGGAGNYRAGEAEREKNERRVLEAQERVHEQVVKDVESELKEPEKAHLGGKKLEYDTRS